MDRLKRVVQQFVGKDTDRDGYIKISKKTGHLRKGQLVDVILFD